MTPSGRTRVAGIAGSPVSHSLSPLIHNAWIEALGLDAVYVPFSPPKGDFERFADGMRGGVIRGVNVTVPFKEQALAISDRSTDRAQRAGAANLLLFLEDGDICADNTDGVGLCGALASQAPALSIDATPAVVLGAGGAARGAVAALLDAGAPEVRVVNRTRQRAAQLAASLAGPITVFSWEEAGAALDTAGLVINATSVGLEGGDLLMPVEQMTANAVAMDMIYRPLKTPFLSRAEGLGLTCVDGLEMLIRQAQPSFEAFFGVEPPMGVDARAIALNALAEATA